MAQRVYEKDETPPVTECAEQKRKQDRGRGGRPISDRVGDKKGDRACC